MKHISILALNGCLGPSVVGPMELFQGVNDYFFEHDLDQYPFFEVDVVGLSKMPMETGHCMSLNCSKTLNEVRHTDLILIPAVQVNRLPNTQAENQQFIEWIQERSRLNNAEVASMCVGAFILAATGLLDNRPCSTHWAAVPLFKQMYPHIELQPEHIITDNNGIYTSGGAMAYQYLALYLIGKYCGRAVALWASKLFLIDMERSSQLHFSTTKAPQNHTDTPILEAQRIIESNFRDNIKVETIADEVAMSKRSFIRRFKKATGHTPIQYIQAVKIDAAKEALEMTDQTVNEIMYDVGYSDVKSFRNLFKKLTGLSPIDYRKKFTGFLEKVN